MVYSVPQGFPSPHHHHYHHHTHTHTHTQRHALQQACTLKIFKLSRCELKENIWLQGDTQELQGDTQNGGVTGVVRCVQFSGSAVDSLALETGRLMLALKFTSL